MTPSLARPARRGFARSRRSLLVGAWLLPSLLCACAGAPSGRPASGPAPQDPAAYYPLEPGWRWAYAIEQSGQTMLATYVVLQRAGDTVVVQAGDDRIHYQLRSDGIVRKAALGADDYVIKAPVRAGLTWPIAGGTAKILSAGQTVELEAGRFDGCAIVEERRDAPARVSRTTYAPGVGPIRIEFDSAGPPAQQVRAVLRGFTKPGQDPLAMQPRP